VLFICFNGGGEVLRTLLWVTLALALAACASRSDQHCVGNDAACSTVGFKIAAAWRPRPGSTNIYVVRLRVGPDGKLAAPPAMLTTPPHNADPHWFADRDEAVRAVLRAQPFDVSAAGLGPMEVRLDPRALPR
jgi:hypothetical protein